MIKQTVFVGLSGGVDSSVAAARLLDQGYKVVGVFIKVWQPDFLKCDAESERLDAMRVAAHLGIPFLTLDAAAEYKKEVGDYFVQEYISGRTPNPDVMCNRHVKFGAFWRFAKEHGADFIATGHYARVEKIQNTNDTNGTNETNNTDSTNEANSTKHKTQTWKLLRGVDTNKDQSYFLWTLTQADLAYVLLPIGDSTKDEVRAEAKRRGLPTAVKKDSQGICFLGHVDIKEFLGHFVELKPGSVLDKNGQQIGTHDGALIYTLGQRHGFTVDGEAGRAPHFVVAKDVENNTITVDHNPPVMTSGSEINLTNTNSVSDHVLEGQLEAQIRYRQQPFRVEMLSWSATEGRLLPLNQIEQPASGQSVVLYQGEECLGGGLVL